MFVDSVCRHSDVVIKDDPHSGMAPWNRVNMLEQTFRQCKPTVFAKRNGVETRAFDGRTDNAKALDQWRNRDDASERRIYSLVTTRLKEGLQNGYNIPPEVREDVEANIRNTYSEGVPGVAWSPTQSMISCSTVLTQKFLGMPNPFKDRVNDIDKGFSRLQFIDARPAGTGAHFRARSTRRGASVPRDARESVGASGTQRSDGKGKGKGKLKATFRSAFPGHFDDDMGGAETEVEGDFEPGRRVKRRTNARAPSVPRAPPTPTSFTPSREHYRERGPPTPSPADAAPAAAAQGETAAPPPAEAARSAAAHGATPKPMIRPVNRYGLPIGSGRGNSASSATRRVVVEGPSPQNRYRDDARPVREDRVNREWGVNLRPRQDVNLRPRATRSFQREVSSGRGGPLPCFHCGQDGHIARQCPGEHNYGSQRAHEIRSGRLDPRSQCLHCGSYSHPTFECDGTFHYQYDIRRRERRDAARADRAENDRRQRSGAPPQGGRQRQQSTERNATSGAPSQRDRPVRQPSVPRRPQGRGDRGVSPQRRVIESLISGLDENVVIRLLMQASGIDPAGTQ